jgi:hypothetical protein
MKMYALRNHPKPVLRLDLSKIDDLRGKVFGNLLFVQLTRNDFTQLGRDNTRMRVFLARDVNTEHIGRPNMNVMSFLDSEMQLYRI